MGHSPDCHEICVEGVVVALVGGAAGLVAAVLHQSEASIVSSQPITAHLAVADQEGGALEHQRVHTHLRVDVQLQGHTLNINI